MDWKTFFATFATVFIAEMGDKTQFAALLVSSQTKSTSAVLIATVLALSLAGSIAVVIGSSFGHYVNPTQMKYISGAAFIVMGLWILLK